MSELTFNAKGHRYELDGKPVTGVTTILNTVISKPALISWAAKETANWIREHCEMAEVLPDLPNQWFVTEEHLQQAVAAHTRKKEAGGVKGTSLHSWVEQFIRAEIKRCQQESI